MRTLDVVNEMLGTMGEAPLNTLEDPHTFRGACLSTLNKLSQNVQARGWWFNRETLEIQPSALDGSVYLPGDFISVRVPRDYGRSTAAFVQRGRRLYDTVNGTFVFTRPVTVTLIRMIPFEDLPELAAQHIAALAVLQYQSKYDGDTAKTREVRDRVENPVTGTLFMLGSEEIRNSQSNFIDSNAKLQRLKNVTNGARRFIR